MGADLFKIIGILFAAAVVMNIVSGSWWSFAVVACVAFALVCVASGLGG